MAGNLGRQDESGKISLGKTDHEAIRTPVLASWTDYALLLCQCGKWSCMVNQCNAL